jgi:20S proteasome alpha/beta subunit
MTSDYTFSKKERVVGQSSPSFRTHSNILKSFKGYATIRHRTKKVKRMTYIIGARCVDGVVLVADRKVTGGIKNYTDKIRPMQYFPDIIFASAGIEPLSQEFLEEVQYKAMRQNKDIENYNKEHPENPRTFIMNDLKHIFALALKKMKNVYSEIENQIPFESALQVLFVVPEMKPPDTYKTVRLFYMDMATCYPIPQEQGKIVPIGISEIGNVFLRNLQETKDFTMKDVARVGAFIIKYVEKEKLDVNDGIGVGDQEPQVWFMGDNTPPHELKDKELKELLDGIDGEVINIIKKIGSSSGFLRS